MAGIDRLPVIKLFGTIISQPSKQENSNCAQNASSSSSSDVETGADEEVCEAGAESMSRDNLINVALPCPRCNSMDTKFCYFNNYNVNQPRHFCRTCNRHWTAGGSLRNVPFGSSHRKARAT